MRWSDRGHVATAGRAPRNSADEPVDLRRRYLNVLLLAAVTAPHAVVNAQQTKQTFVVTDFDWVDQSRSRPVPSRLYWPTRPASEGSVPLVVFSHGIGGSRRG